MSMGCAARDVELWRFILRGCMLSIAYTRVFLRTPLGKVAEVNPRADLSLYVDDAGQCVECDECKVAKWHAQGAVAFVRMARSFDLQPTVSNPAAGSKGEEHIRL